MRASIFLFAGALTACGSSAARSDAGPASILVLDRAVIHSRGTDNVQHALAAVDLGPGPWARATLILDLDSPCYPYERWQTDPPPEGQFWPADCDSATRSLEISFDPPTGFGAPPPFEVERAATPFGGPEHLVVDVTDFANAFPGAHTLDVYIPTMASTDGTVSGSAGSWTVTVRLETTPGPAPRHVLGALVLENGTFNRGDDPHTVAVSIPDGVTAARLEYRATGEGNTAYFGGCGSGEDFCQRTHHLQVDGVEIAAPTPWRTDCDKECTVAHQGPAGRGFDYCLENPTGSYITVPKPRANWCPGTDTPPMTFDPTGLHAPGSHSFSYTIDGINTSGWWRVSAVLYLFGS